VGSVRLILVSSFTCTNYYYRQLHHHIRSWCFRGYPFNGNTNNSIMLPPLGYDGSIAYPWYTLYSNVYWGTTVRSHTLASTASASGRSGCPVVGTVSSLISCFVCRRFPLMYAAAISHCISSNSFSYRFQNYSVLGYLFWIWSMRSEPLRNFVADLMATRRPRLDITLFDLSIRYYILCLLLFAHGPI